jgi:hypothetical protein
LVLLAGAAFGVLVAVGCRASVGDARADTTTRVFDFWIGRYRFNIPEHYAPNWRANGVPYTGRSPEFTLFLALPDLTPYHCAPADRARQTCPPRLQVNASPGRVRTRPSGWTYDPALGDRWATVTFDDVADDGTPVAGRCLSRRAEPDWSVERTFADSTCSLEFEWRPGLRVSLVFRPGTDWRRVYAGASALVQGFIVGEEAP